MSAGLTAALQENPDVLSSAARDNGAAFNLIGAMGMDKHRQTFAAYEFT